MKKTFKIILFLVVTFLVMFSLPVFAAELNTLSVTLDKTTVNPNQNVTINFAFGQPLGAYTFTIDYDDALLDCISTTGTTDVSIEGDKVHAMFFDTTGGSNPSSNMSVTFKAKNDTVITSSNPTQFMITATGLANPTASITFDDITTPIVKDLMVEPAYGEYVISIDYKEPILKEKEHPIDVTVKATDGRMYEHVRLIAEVTKPDGSTFKLLGIDNAELEHDVILSGWGDPAGFGLGGDVDEVYHFRGLFSADGEYTLTLKLIDRDDSDTVIASTTKKIRVGIIPTQTPEPEEETVLPKTGVNLYVYFGIIAVAAISTYVIINKKYS